MAFWLLALAVIGLQTSAIYTLPSCPAQTATFVLQIDQLIDGFSLTRPDPELTFFREIMGFRDQDIQNSREEAMKFFNETYGLDFSQSEPNDQQELVFENARVRPARFLDELDFRVIFNNWIQTGNTRTSCAVVHAGEFNVYFVGDQLLHGSYGGETGIEAGRGNFIFYGYNRIDVCQQSPVIIQYQSATPTRRGPDGIYTVNYDIYNNVLGYGKATGTYTYTPDPESGRLHFYNPVVYTFGRS